MPNLSQCSGKICRIDGAQGLSQECSGGLRAFSVSLLAHPSARPEPAHGKDPMDLLMGLKRRPRASRELLFLLPSAALGSPQCYMNMDLLSPRVWVRQGPAASVRVASRVSPSPGVRPSFAEIWVGLTLII